MYLFLVYRDVRFKARGSILLNKVADFKSFVLRAAMELCAQILTAIQYYETTWLDYSVDATWSPKPIKKVSRKGEGTSNADFSKMTSAFYL